MGIVSVEIDGVCSQKWNADWVIVFQSVILQHAQGINNSAQIRKRILFQPDLWNRGVFDELVKDMYNSDMGYLGKHCGNKTTEESHQTFLNIFPKGKLREAVQFICDREKGGVFNLTNWLRIVRERSTRPSHWLWR